MVSLFSAVPCNVIIACWVSNLELNWALQLTTSGRTEQRTVSNWNPYLYYLVNFNFTTSQWLPLVNFTEKLAKMGRVYLENFGGARIFSCLKCETFLTNRGELLSTRFTGATGRAFLFNKVVNLKYGYVQLSSEFWTPEYRTSFMLLYTFRVRYLNGWTIPPTMDEIPFKMCVLWLCVLSFIKFAVQMLIYIHNYA